MKRIFTLKNFLLFFIVFGGVIFCLFYFEYDKNKKITEQNKYSLHKQKLTIKKEEELKNRKNFYVVEVIDLDTGNYHYKIYEQGKSLDAIKKELNLKNFFFKEAMKNSYLDKNLTAIEIKEKMPISSLIKDKNKGIEKLIFFGFNEKLAKKIIEKIQKSKYIVWNEFLKIYGLGKTKLEKLQQIFTIK